MITAWPSAGEGDVTCEAPFPPLPCLLQGWTGLLPLSPGPVSHQLRGLDAPLPHLEAGFLTKSSDP